jgi:hypothetical protein
VEGGGFTIRRRLTICPTKAVHLELYVFGLEASMTGDPGQDSASQFGVVVKSELVVWDARVRRARPGVPALRRSSAQSSSRSSSLVRFTSYWYSRRWCLGSENGERCFARDHAFGRTLERSCQARLRTAGVMVVSRRLDDDTGAKDEAKIGQNCWKWGMGQSSNKKCL